ncbi:MAG: hypothetical protein NTZ09_02670 [Candidatus Hydrogenedentes bacterium]|nr:hypothetical protein [Candidatus Hydrogenedentota bacterium]
MGGEAWGGATVPVGLSTMYSAINGLQENGTWDKSVPPGTTALWGIYNVRQEIERLWGDVGYESPYALAVLHDPNPELDDALSRLEDADLLLQMFDPETDWEDLLNRVKAKIDSDLTWEGDIDAVVDAFDTANIPLLQRSKARQQAQLGEFGAAYGTAFFLAGAELEGAHNNKVAQYRAEMLLEAKKLRASIILQGVAQLFEALRYRIESNRIMAQMRLSFATANITANSDLVANQLKVDVEAEKWNLNLLADVKSTNILGGAPSLQRGTPEWAAALSLGLNAIGGLANVIPGIAGALK